MQGTGVWTDAPEEGGDAFKRVSHDAQEWCNLLGHSQWREHKKPKAGKAEERARPGGLFLHLRDLREAMRCGNTLTGHFKKRNCSAWQPGSAWAGQSDEYGCYVGLGSQG